MLSHTRMLDGTMLIHYISGEFGHYNRKGEMYRTAHDRNLTKWSWAVILQAREQQWAIQRQNEMRQSRFEAFQARVTLGW
jgi:hypothetical protein